MGLFNYFKGVYERWIDYPERRGKLLAGKYRIVRFLGMGSYGLTYLCKVDGAEEQLVVKKAKPSKGQYGLELLQREMEILRQLEYPSIPRCVDGIAHGNQFYLVMEYVPGRTVEDLIFERGAVFSEREALSFIRKLMDIVGFVHQRGYAHLDIRIPNVILQEERMVLIDFGLACRLSDPPRLDADADEETLRRRSVNVTSDLYAIGHFLLFMLYSAYVPDDKEMKQTAGWEEELQVSAETKSMFRKLLQIDPPYADGQAFIQQLDDSLSRLLQ